MNNHLYITVLVNSKDDTDMGDEDLKDFMDEVASITEKHGWLHIMKGKVVENEYENM
jgi:hypothetical protein